MTEAILNYIQNTTLSSWVVGLSIIGLSGTFVGTYFSYLKYLELKKLRNLEYNKVNVNLDIAIKDFEEYHENIEYKNALFMKKKTLEILVKSNNLNEMFKNCTMLRTNEQFQIAYKNLNNLDLNLERKKKAIFLIKIELEKYTDELNKFLKNSSLINNKYENLLRISLAENYEKKTLISGLKMFFEKQKIFFFKQMNEANDINLAKQIKFNFDNFQSKNQQLKILVEKRINLDLKAKNLKILVEDYNVSLENYEILENKLITDVNKILQLNFNSLDEKIQNLNIKENEYLETNNDKLSLLKQYITPQNLILDELYEKRQLNLLKALIWKDNEINKLYLNSNHTYFWLCYEEFCKNVKNKIIYHFSKKPDHSKILDHDKFLKDNEAFFKNIQYNTKPPLNWGKKSSTNLHFIEQPEFQLINTNHSQWDSFYFDLFVFSWQIYFFQHIYLLQYIIPIIYSVIALLVGYVLYKKIKYAYSCYKQKILKVTFLNWLFDPEILFTTSKLGIFYTITIIVLLGILYNFSGFGYWFTFLICGRVFVWNWIKYGIYKLKLIFW